MMMTLKATILGACALLMAGAASAATLSSRPSTVLYEGSALYGFDLAVGFGLAVGETSDGAFSFEISGGFDPFTPGYNPTDVNVLLTEIASFETVLDGIGLEEVEVGAGFVALLLGDLAGPAASAFTGGELLVILRDPAFPALNGSGTFELRRLDSSTVIPLPAAAPLMLAGMGALVIVGRKRRRSPQ